MPDLVKPLRGKVARILSSRELALNIGARDGVEVGMRFDVLDPKGEGIRDPETGEELGSVLRPKVRVRVTLIQDRLSVASTYRTREINIGGRASSALYGVLMPNLFMPEKWVRLAETLKTTEQTWEDLQEEHSFVKTGDPVQQVLGSDEDDEVSPAVSP